MFETYAFAPTFSIFFAGIFQTFLLVSYVLFPQNYETDNKVLRVFHKFFMHFFFILFFLFGLVFFDAAILWLMGHTTYADWRFQLPSVILLLIIGFQYVVGSMFINPKLGNLIFAVCVGAVVLILIHVYIPMFRLLYGVLMLLPLFFLFQLIYLLLNVYLYKKDSSKLNEIKWNWTEKFQKIFSRKFNVILFCILMVEVWLKLFASSLFIW